MIDNHSEGFANAAIQKRIEQLEASASDDSIRFDLLRLYFGEDYWIDDKYIICQPCIQDFLEYGENEVYGAIAPFTSNPTSRRVQLWDLGIDWNTIKDIELFAMLIKSLDTDYAKFMFKRIMTKDEQDKFLETTDDKNIDFKQKQYLVPLDFTLFDPYNKTTVDEDGNEHVEIVLYDKDNKLEINQATYEDMCDYIRFMFNTHPEVEYCKGKTLKRQLIQNDRLKQAQMKAEQGQSNMLSLISFALNHPGFKYKKNELREVGIVEFMDSIQRLQIYESTRALYGGMYSGFCDTSKINKDEFNFMRDIKVKKE